MQKSLKKLMEKNAWHGAKPLVSINNRAPVLNEQIEAYLLKDKQGQFIFIREYLLKNHSAPFYCFPLAGQGKFGTSKWWGKCF